MNSIQSLIQLIETLPNVQQLRALQELVVPNGAEQVVDVTRRADNESVVECIARIAEQPAAVSNGSSTSTHAPELDVGAEVNGVEQLGDTTYDSFLDALLALYEHSHKSKYPLSHHQRRAPNSHGVVVDRFRCEQKGCKVAASIYFNTIQTKSAWIVPSKHAHNHPPPSTPRKPLVMKLAYIKRLRDSMERNACTRFSAYNDINPTMASVFGVSYNPKQLSKVVRGEDRRRIREQLGAEALGGDALFEFDEDGAGAVLRSMEASSTELELRAAIGILRRLAGQKDSYVHVLHRNNSIDYMFWCGKWQREQMARYGQLSFIDDAHGRTNCQYHLATFALINGHCRIVPGALCFFGSSCHTWWRQFMKDCQAAARVTRGSGPRPWTIGIADQHASIHGAAEEVGVTMFDCYHHFTENINKSHSTAAPFTRPMHELLHKYLDCSCEQRLRLIEAEISAALASFPERFESAREKERTFFSNCKEKRQLTRVSSFTYGYTSQSVAEAVFAWGKKVGIGPSVSVPLALKRLIDLVDRLEADDRRQTLFEQEKRGQQFGELAKVEKLLTAKGFDRFFSQYIQVIEYATEKVGDNIFDVFRKVGGRNNNVYKVNACTGECECNMEVWMELPCRHLIAVRILNSNGFFADSFVWQPRWRLHHPAVEFLERGPCIADYDAALVAAAQTTGGDESGEQPLEAPPSAVEAALPPLVIGSAPDEARPTNPAELQADIRQRFDSVLGAIGHSIPALRHADEMVSYFVSSTRPIGLSQPSFQPCGKRIGRPRELRLKSSAVKVKCNQTRKRKRGSCTVCKSISHNKRKCPVILAWRRDQEKKSQREEEEISEIESAGDSESMSSSDDDCGCSTGDGAGRGDVQAWVCI
eukprot:GHVU01005264.1.p1 GENE.GHVU01005264.1~~GHVU01005264.1.p1  ORF type:complete len:873 (+),score=77.55 GHVU01005264.1:34-2652(+)